MILPAVCLGWFQVAAMMRLVRSSMLDVLDSEFVKLTRIKGLPEWKVVWKHCLRNAAIAPLTYFAITAGVLITGSVVIESVFAWPGTGLLAVDAVRARDFQVVQAIVIIFAAVFIMTNLLVDILYAYIDPRIRYSVTLERSVITCCRKERVSWHGNTTTSPLVHWPLSGLLRGMFQVRRFPGVAMVILVFLLVIPGLFAEWVAPHDPIKGSLAARLKPPMWEKGGSSHLSSGHG